MAETLTIDFSQPVPVFPLPNCVLLPHATIPLHIFEPRYCEMVCSALDSNGLIAMATFRGDQWKKDYHGNPAMRPHVCVGYIVRHDVLPGDRYNILLQGVCRARIIEEVPHELFRTAMLEPTEDQAALQDDLSQQRADIEALLADHTLSELAAVDAIDNWLSDEIPTVALIDLATMRLCDQYEDRYRMLEEAAVTKRARWLMDYLHQARHSLSMADRFEHPDAESYCYPN